MSSSTVAHSKDQDKVDPNKSHDKDEHSEATSKTHEKTQDHRHTDARRKSDASEHTGVRRKSDAEKHAYADSHAKAAHAGKGSRLICEFVMSTV